MPVSCQLEWARRCLAVCKEMEWQSVPGVEPSDMLGNRMGSDASMAGIVP